MLFFETYCLLITPQMKNVLFTDNAVQFAQVLEF